MTTAERRVLIVVSSGSFLASLDLFIVNIAFPAINVAYPDSTPASLSWILNGYTISFAALLAPAGRTADRIGRRRVFLAGLVVFMLASAGAAAAWSVWSLVAFRVVQSSGAAMMLATSLALLLHAFPPARRAMAIGVWSSVGAAAATFGPPVGGLLVQSSWRWIFLVNLPVGLAAWLVGRRVLAESRDEEENRRPDVIGTVLLIVGVGAIAYALVTAPDHGWGGATTIGVLSGGIVVTGAMLVRAGRTPARLVPVFPLALFRSRAFAAACVTAVVFMTSFGTLLLGNVLFLTGYWQASALRAGLYLLPGPVITSCLSVVGGRLGHRFGAGQTATVGIGLFTAASVYWLWRVDGPEDYLRDFLPGQVVAGIGTALTLTNLAAAVSSTLPPQSLATGTAALNASRQIGTALGVALLLAVIGSSTVDGTLVRFQHAWILMAVTSGLACVTAAVIGRADHPDLRGGRTSPTNPRSLSPVRFPLKPGKLTGERDLG